MWIDAIYDKGRLKFSPHIRFTHRSFKVKVDVPEAEIPDTVRLTVAQKLPLSHVSEIGPGGQNVESNTSVEGAVSDEIQCVAPLPSKFVEFMKWRYEAFGIRTSISRETVTGSCLHCAKVAGNL
jgi:hypothetical protein